MSRTLNYFNYQESLFFYKIPYCLIILIPFFLISGPLLTDISISLCALIFLINSIKYKLKRFYNNFFFFILFLFYIILIISSISSNNPIISVKTSIFYIRFLIFSLSVWYIVSVNPKIINHLFYSISFAFTILIFDGYFQFFFEKNLFGMPIQGTRISSFFGSELILGSYISRLLPLLFACFIFLNKKNNYLILFSLFIFIFAEILIFLSGERTAFFYLNFSIVILIFLLNNYKKFRIISFLISMIIIIFLSFLYPKFKERIIDNTIHSFGFADKNKYINTQKKK